MKNIWECVRLPIEENQLWELYHENSKNTRFAEFLTPEEIVEEMKKMHESLPYIGKSAFDLSRNFLPLDISLKSVITNRHTARELEPVDIDIETLSTLLNYSYGINRDLTEKGFARPFRMIPSGGGMYPLEIYFFTRRVKELPAGLYHYQVEKNQIRLIKGGNFTDKISKSMIQEEISGNSSIVFFLTALFKKTMFKYNDRGYRFILFEAGHLAQNLNLICNALDLGSINIGGFYDKDIDEFLEIDGVTHSTIYMMAIGKDK